MPMTNVVWSEVPGPQATSLGWGNLAWGSSQWGSPATVAGIEFVTWTEVSD